MNKILKRLSIIATSLAMAIGVGVAIGSSNKYKEARADSFTFAPSSKSAGKLSNAPSGITYTFSNTYDSGTQITKNNSMTLTLKTTNDTGYTINSISLSCKNNASKGNGAATASLDGTESFTYSSITGLGNANWSTLTMNKESGVSNFTFNSSRDLVITVSASANSVYCSLFTIDYSVVPTANYSVSFNAGNGTGTWTGAANVTTNGSYQVPDNSGFSYSVDDVSYYFIGWRKDNNDSGAIYAPGETITGIDADVTLYAQWAAPAVATYKANSGSGDDIVDSGVKPGTSITLKAANTFSKDGGYRLSGWKANNEGDLLSAGSSYTLNASTDFYAQWVKTYTVTYKANDGSATADVVSDPYDTGTTTATTIANPFSRDGYRFLGWSLTNNGDVVYDENDTLATIDSDVTLFAKWQKTYTVSYNANGGTGSIDTQTYDENTTTATAASSGFLKSGYRLASWKIDNASSGDDVSLGGTLPTITADIVLYAQWQKTFTVTYNANGGSGSIATQTYDENTSNVKAAAKNAGISRSSYRLMGWKINNEGDLIECGGDIPTITADVVLYAQWVREYTVSYNSNGGTGSMSDSEGYIEGEAVTILENSFTKPLHTFAGWKIGDDDVSDSFTMPANNVTLTAQWEAGPGSDVNHPFSVAGVIDYIKSGSYSDSQLVYVTGYVKADANDTYDIVDDLSADNSSYTKFFRFYDVDETEPKKGDLVVASCKVKYYENYNGTIKFYESSASYTRISLVKEEITRLELSETSITAIAGDTFNHGGTATITYKHQGEQDPINLANNRNSFSYEVNGNELNIGDKLYANLHDGTATVTYSDGKGHEATADLALNVSYKATAGVSLDKTSHTLYKNDSVTLIATVTDQFAPQTVKWLSSDSTVASVSNGVVTSYEKAGNATITAYSDEDNDDVLDEGEKRATCDIEVITERTLVIDKSSISAYVGDDEQTINVTTARNFANNASFTWISSDEDVALVEGTKTSATVILGNEGTSTITLLVKDDEEDEGESVTCSVTVSGDEMSLSWTGGNYNFKVGDKFTLSGTVIASYENRSDKNVTLSTSGVKVLLGGSEITPTTYTFTAADDGKTIAIQYTDSSIAADTLVAVTEAHKIRVLRTIVVGADKTGTYNFATSTSSGAAVNTIASFYSSKDSLSSPTETTLTRVFTDDSQLKLGNSSNGGELDLDFGKVIKYVKVSAKQYKNGENAFSIMGQSESATSSYTDYEFTAAENAIATSLSITSSKRLYIKSIEVIVANSTDYSLNSSAIKVHDFINKYMHTDIEFDDDPTLDINKKGDCKTEGWYVDAKAAFNGDEVECALDNEARLFFIQYKDSYYKNEYDRLMAWAKAHDDELIATTVNDVVTDYTLNITASNSIINNIQNDSTVAIIILTSLSLIAVGGYFLLRRRKEY